jgi:DNA helicase-2/ATP-dependent DNA helicase PcrA
MIMNKDWTAGCNEAQSAVIDFDGNALIVSAGPGTGKTHTLVRRIARLAGTLQSRQRVLAITFTNKAAQELMIRIQGFDRTLAKLCMITTFHRWCMAQLRVWRRFDGISIPQRRIALPDELESLMEGVWPQVPVKERRQRLEDISFLKSQGLSHDNLWLEDYQSALAAAGVWDFDDILTETVRMLTCHEPLLEWVRRSFPVICVDEYQDINPVQRHLIGLITTSSTRLTVIGDPNQSIYLFRGSQPEFFHQFEQDFPGAHALQLCDNYRSGQHIIGAALDAIGSVDESVRMPLKAHHQYSGHVTVNTFDQQQDEAEFVVRQIEALIGGIDVLSDHGQSYRDDVDDVGFSDIAVLYRLNSLGRGLRSSFERRGIPYHLHGADSFDAACPDRYEDVKLLGDRVTLMSVHASKGLEFDVVFMIGCEDCLFPLQLDSIAGDLNEEGRLFYVGLTRAKKALYVSYCRNRFIFGQRYDTKPSPFVTAIDARWLSAGSRQPRRRKRKCEYQPSLF